MQRGGFRLAIGLMIAGLMVIWLKITGFGHLEKSAGMGRSPGDQQLLRDDCRDVIIRLIRQFFPRENLTYGRRYVLTMKIGVLDIQGSVEEHFEALKRLKKARPDLKIEPVLVKKASDLSGVRGLIIPGGESTTIGKLLKKTGLWEEIKKRARGLDGFAVWGTCAGAILLSKDYLGLMDIAVERNAYGRQVDSFETEIEFDGGDGTGARGAQHRLDGVPAIFIRAPKITRVGSGVKVLAKCDGEIVAATCGKLLVTTFHPELTESLKVHECFVELSRLTN